MENLIYVLGSKGYLGNNILSYLEDNKFEVIGISKKFTLESLDYLDFQDNSILINCAGPNACKCNDPLIAKNFYNDINLKLAKIIQKRNMRYFHLSTMHIYGEDNRVINEKSDLKGISNYVKFRIKHEKYIENSSNIKNCSIIRVGNIFGFYKNKCGDYSNLSINQFIDETLKGNAIEIKSNIETFRDYVSIDYLLQLIKFCIENKDVPRVINCISGNSYSALSMAKKVVTFFYGDISEDKIICKYDSKILSKNLCSNEIVKNLIGEENLDDKIKKYILKQT